MDFKTAPYIFAFILIIIVFFARFISVFSLSIFQYLLRMESKLKIKELKIVWYSGLIRGIIIKLKLFITKVYFYYLRCYSFCSFFIN